MHVKNTLPLVFLAFGVTASFVHADNYLSLEYGRYEPTYSDNISYSKTEAISDSKKSRVEGRFSKKGSRYLGFEFSYIEADTYDRQIETKLDSNSDHQLIAFLGNALKGRPRLMLEDTSVTARYLVEDDSRITDENGRLLKQGDQFDLAMNVEKIGFVWGEDQRLNYMAPQTNWMFALHYYQADVDYLIVSEAFSSAGQGRLESDTFSAIGFHGNGNYLLEQPHKGHRWFWSIGPDIELAVGELLRLKTGYFTSVGYRHTSGLALALSIQGSVLDVSSIRVDTEIDETVETLSYSGLSHEWSVKARWDF